MVQAGLEDEKIISEYLSFIQNNREVHKGFILLQKQITKA
jgi:hypothetical protein